MKKLLVVLALFSLFCIPALAETPQVEVYGGYSLLHDTGLTAHGFQAAVEGNITDYLSVVGEFGFHKKDLTDEVNFIMDVFDLGDVTIENADLKDFTFMVGPRVSYRTEKVRPFGHVLFGIQHLSASGTVEGESDSETLNNFAMVFGGGIDISVNDSISIRPIQVDLLSTRFNFGPLSMWENMLRYSAGVVFKIGSK